MSHPGAVVESTHFRITNQGPKAAFASYVSRKTSLSLDLTSK